MSKYHSLFWALLSDCDELVKSLALLIGGRPEIEEEMNHPFYRNFGYAMKYILLNNYDQARPHVEELKRLLGIGSSEEELDEGVDIRLSQGYMIVLDGILRSDLDTVQTGLACQLQAHKKDPEYRNTPDQFFSIPVLALAKLAIRQGMPVTLDDPIAPQIMLEKHHIEYPEIDFI